jgi:hypothetical protein
MVWHCERKGKRERQRGRALSSHDGMDRDGIGLDRNLTNRALTELGHIGRLSPRSVSTGKVTNLGEGQVLRVDWVIP